jgi:outer membrane immunogenic protein
MLKHFGSAMIFAGLATSAMAADMPLKAPAAVAAVNWTGLYSATSIGGYWSDLQADWPNRVPLTLPGSFDHDQSTGITGSHLGIQFQYSNIVLGVEGGFSRVWSERRVIGTPQTGCPSPALTCLAGLNNIFTIGPRLGIAFNNWLFYGTGGYASGRIESQSFTNATGLQVERVRVRDNGWFAGGGIDYMLMRNTLFGDVIVGVEYQHVDLGTTTIFSPIDPVAGGPNLRNITASADIARARLTFKPSWFGGGS